MIENGCEHCGAINASQYFKRTIASGAKVLEHRCEKCGNLWRKGRSFSPMHLFTPERYDELPVSPAQEFLACFCVVSGCENTGVEWHHFAPKSKFGDVEADMWPVLPLCKEHHDKWHKVMGN
jgi:hypothetical protein